MHSFWLRSRWAGPLRVPSTAARTWRRRRIFGDNKTWAGFLVLPPAAGRHFLLRLAAGPCPAPEWRPGLCPPGGEYVLLGVWTGLGFMAGELPNSFVKRQFDVGPGRAPHRPGRLARAAGFRDDRVDSIAGASAAQAVVVPVGLRYAFYLLLVGPGLHWLFSVLLFHLGVKRRRL